MQEFTEFIEQIYHVNIVLDTRVIAPKKPSQSVTDGMIQNVDLKNVTVDQALRAILEPLHLAYVVRHNDIWISTPDKIKYPVIAELETRSFTIPTVKVPDVNGTIHNNPPPEVDVIALIARILPIEVEPDSGKQISFTRFNVQTNQLVVHDTPENLRRVQQLLNLIFGDTPGREE